MALLYALTGSFDASGGNVLFPAVPATPITGEELPAAKRLAPAIGLAERPLGPARWNAVSTHDFYRAVLEGIPYPVRGLVGFGANLLLAQADPVARPRGAFGTGFLRPCRSVHDADAAQADIVLPIASCFEREALKIGFEISAGRNPWCNSVRPWCRHLERHGPTREFIFDLAGAAGAWRAFLGTAISMPPIATSSAPAA